MNGLKNKFLTLLLITTLVFLNVFSLTAKAEPSSDPLNVNAEAAILVDAQSGKILYQKNIDQPLYPASMTKMMTEYLVLDAVDQGKITWDQKISISDYVFKVSQDKSLSNVYLRKDVQYTVRELYESMAIYSANGSTVALAELIAGSETNFIKMMNDKAQEMGMKDTKFVNSTGLNNADLFGLHPEGTGQSDENLMPARAVATLAFRLLHDHPEVLETSSIPEKMFQGGTPDENKMQNWNWMLPGSMYPVLDYPGVDGIKTGSTDLGGYSFTGTVKRDNMRLLSVVMKTTGDKLLRFKETKKLFDYGFAHYSQKEIFPAGYSIPNLTELPVVKGKAKKVGVVTQKPLSILIKNGDENMYVPGYVMDKSIEKDGALIAPLSKDQAVGYLTVNYNGTENYEYLTADGAAQEQVPIITTSGVKKAGWLTMLFRSIGEFFTGLFKK